MSSETLPQQCLRLFGLTPTTPLHRWLIAADWLEDRGDEAAAAAFRERLWSPIDPVGDIDGDSAGVGYGAGNYVDGGMGDGTGGYDDGGDDGEGYSFGEGDGYGSSDGRGGRRDAGRTFGFTGFGGGTGSGRGDGNGNG